MSPFSFRQPLLHLVSTGGDEGNRTLDPLLAGQVLSQLSYTPIRGSLFRDSATDSSLKIEQHPSVLQNLLAASSFALQDLKWFLRTPSSLHRKEVIQPHLPIRLPCYDLTPIIEPTFDCCLLAVSSQASGVPNFHGLTGGVYKARERIHRGMLTRDY